MTTAAPSAVMPTSNLDVGSIETALDTCACFNLRKASRHVTKVFDRVLMRSIGLRSTQIVILMTVATKEAVTIAELARRVLMAPSTMNRNIRPLVRGGYLEVTAGKDARSRTVLITPAGRAVVQQAVPSWKEAQGQIVERLGDTKWEELRARLAEIAPSK